VLPSTLKVVAQSRLVQTGVERVQHFVADRPLLKIPPLQPGPPPYHYYDGTAVTAQWLFVLDTLNHCFWPRKGKQLWEIEYQNRRLSGYWALAASLKRAMEEGITIHRATTLVNLDRQTLQHVFRGRGEIPLLDARLENLQQAGRILIERFQGNFVHLIEEAARSAVALTLLLVQHFPSFNDVAAYRDNRVYFYKRAQLLALDLWSTFSGEFPGQFADLDQLTAFADYKLPQVLRHLHLIEYTPELAAKVDNLVPISPGSEAEVEIRAATIWVVEWLRRELASRGHKVISAQIDNWLWHLGQQQRFRQRPYHRTLTIFY